METSILIFHQLCMMFLYLLIGFGLFRRNILTGTGSKDIASLLVHLVIPAVIIRSFCVPFSRETLEALCISTVVGAVLLFLSAAAARVIFGRKPIEQFAAAFSNAGFMGIPLIQGALGEEAVIFTVPFIAMLNFLQWTYGAGILQQKTVRKDWRSMICNPIMTGTVLGVVLFMTGLGARLPEVLSSALGGVCELNTPLAMLVLGTYLAKEKLRDLFTAYPLYAVSAVRQILIPVLSLMLLMFIPADHKIKYALLIAASCPVGANVAVYAQLYGKDYAYAGKAVVLSTLLSLLTLPVIVLAGSGVFV